ncbi:MAG TPA: glycosyltransferase family 87 protein [Candidatus Limnocylindrales bacterium]
MRVAGLTFPPLRMVLFAISAALCLSVLAVYTATGGSPVDALCYWFTNPNAPYRPDSSYQFVYSPAAAQIAWPLLLLPFEAFTFVLRVVETLSLIVLGGPIAGLLVFTPPVATEVNAANINILLALLMVLGFRWPALWAPALLTKPSMGVGLLWFVVRGEWRKLATAVGVAGAVSLVSFLYAPHIWFDWIAFLRTGTYQDGGWPFPWPVWIRLPFAIALVVWGARTNRSWTVVAAAVLALPRLYFLSPAMLVGMLPLIRATGERLTPRLRRIAGIDAELEAPHEFRLPKLSLRLAGAAQR